MSECASDHNELVLQIRTFDLGYDLFQKLQSDGLNPYVDFMKSDLMNFHIQQGIKNVLRTNPGLKEQVLRVKMNWVTPDGNPEAQIYINYV